MSVSAEPETLQIRRHGTTGDPTLVYLPGLHGDWTLLGPFRKALAGRAQLLEVTYPRRSDWTLEDYARAVQSGLRERGIAHGWVLGESFSSQVAWPFVSQSREHPGDFQPDGLILVGGFVRHPWPWGVFLARCASHRVPAWLLRSLCRSYGRMAGRRYAECPEILAEFKEFVVRRTTPSDRQAITQRYRLLGGCDPRPLARQLRLPVFHLTGAFDPIVPWWQVRPWLRRHCPGYRGSRVVWRAGHNVLLSAPNESAEQILKWVSGEVS